MFCNYDIVSRIRKSPKDYLGDDTLPAFEAFFLGYGFEYGLVLKNDLLWLDFDAWIHARTGIVPGIHSAFSVLRLISLNDREALQMFFQEFDACLAANKYARDSARWPQPPPTRTTIPSKRAYLSTLRHRPHFYFTSKSIGLVWALFAGHDCSVADLGQEPDALNILDFERWLGEQVQFPTTYRWDRVLEYLSLGNEDKAFRLFFEYLQRYLLEKNDPWVEGLSEPSDS